MGGLNVSRFTQILIATLILIIGVLLGYIIKGQSPQDQEQDVSAKSQMRDESPLLVSQTENQEPNQRTVDELDGVDISGDPDKVTMSGNMMEAMIDDEVFRIPSEDVADGYTKADAGNQKLCKVILSHLSKQFSIERADLNCLGVWTMPMDGGISMITKVYYQNQIYAYYAADSDGELDYWFVIHWK